MKSTSNTSMESRKSAADAKTDNSSATITPASSTFDTIYEKSSDPITRTSKESLDNILLNDSARQKLLAGADKIADAVALTLGSAGASAVIEDARTPFHRVVDDGVSVARAINLKDPYENMGANLMKEIAGQADKDSGDGTSTATVIARALLHTWEPSANPQEDKKAMDDALSVILKEIDSQTEQITSTQVGQVAFTSSNDQSLSNLLQEIYEKVGKEGIVEIDNSNLPDTFYDIVEGVRFRGALALGEYSFTEKTKAVYENAPVLVTREKIAVAKNIEDIAIKLSQQGINQMVVFFDEIDMNVASRIALTHLNGNFRIHLIKAPTLFKDWFFEDFARVTGATVIDGKEGKTFKNMLLSDLGKADKIITTREETRVIGGKDLTEHIAYLKEIKGDDNIPVRLSWLQTKVAILKMGANSEAELTGKKAKAIDAISACHHALNGGVVTGGGRTLAGISTGNEAIDTALKAPLHQMEENMGHSMPDTSSLKDMGIFDPAPVVKNSVKAAISVASTFLSTKIAIKLNKDETPRQMPYMQ